MTPEAQATKAKWNKRQMGLHQTSKFVCIKECNQQSKRSSHEIE
jgi:hypothetical protein